jgi:hypothetical protein
MFKKKKAVKVTQQQTFNAGKVAPSVFTKTLLSTQNPGSQTIVGANLPYASLGGVLLTNMPDINNIVALYNRYKFLAVTYTFNCQPTTNSGVSLAAIDLPKLYVRYNYDSNLTTASLLQKFQEWPNVKQFQFTNDKTQIAYTYYPRCVEPVYLSGIASGYKLAKQQYIDCQYSNVPHYGLAVYIDNIVVGCSVTLDITYKVAFKYSN